MVKPVFLYYNETKFEANFCVKVQRGSLTFKKLSTKCLKNLSYFLSTTQTSNNLISNSHQLYINHISIIHTSLSIYEFLK